MERRKERTVNLQKRVQIETLEGNFIKNLVAEYGSQGLFIDGKMLKSTENLYDVDLTLIEEIKYNKDNHRLIITEESGETLLVDFDKEIIKLLENEENNIMQKYNGDIQELDKYLEYINTVADKNVEYKIINDGIIETDYKIRCTCLICLLSEIDEIGLDIGETQLIITLKNKEENEIDTIALTKNGAEM